MNQTIHNALTMIDTDAQNRTQLRRAFARFATGVTVITCTSDSGPVGITANSFSSISLEPPLVMWAAALASRRYPAFQAAQHYAIHVLGREQQDVCDLFTRDGFALRSLDHEVNPEGVPLLPDCLARFECRQTAIHPAGDHAIILGEVQRAAARDGDALTFFAGRFTPLSET